MKDSKESCIRENQYGERLRAPLVKGNIRGDRTETEQEKRSASLKLRIRGMRIKGAR